MSELEPIIKRSNLSVRAHHAAGLPRLEERPAEGQTDCAQSPEQRAQVHAGGIGHDRGVVRCAGTGRIGIAVRDTGVGIAPDDQREGIRRLSSARQLAGTGYGGTGLGLSICRRLSQMLGGTIDLDSEVGKGSTFTLRLPARLRKR